MTAPDPQSSNVRKPAREKHGGAYGFSRFEIRALLTVALIVAAAGLYRWWQRASELDAPPWVIENVLLESAEAKEDQPRGAPKVSPHESYQSSAPSTETTIDVNTASVNQLSRLPGVGPVLAERIVVERDRNGPFRDLLDLKRVSGIGAGKAAALNGWVRFSHIEKADTSGIP